MASKWGGYLHLLSEKKILQYDNNEIFPSCPNINSQNEIKLLQAYYLNNITNLATNWDAELFKYSTIWNILAILCCTHDAVAYIHKFHSETACTTSIFLVTTSAVTIYRWHVEEFSRHKFCLTISIDKIYKTEISENSSNNLFYYKFLFVG